jgi:hypothetical protein
LKVLEEPPRQAMLLLVSHAPGSLLPTLRSRCRKLILKALPDETVRALLRRYRPELGEADAAALALLAEGSIGRALELDDAGGLALYRDLLHTRRKEIVPLLPRLRGAGTYQVQGAHGLIAEWAIADGPRLCLYANLGPEPLEHAPQPHHGRILATVGEGMAESLASGRWPPWSVAWGAALGPTVS